MTINPSDEEAFKRIVNFPTRGIGDTSIEKILIAARDNDISLFTACENITELNLAINSGTVQKIQDFVTMIQSFSALLPVQNAYDLGNHIAKTSGLLHELHIDKTPEGVSRYENVLELLNGLKEFSDGALPPAIDLNENKLEFQDTNETNKELEENTEESLPMRTLDQFMQDIALLTDADKKENDEDVDRVSLMTIHASKGLEFPYLFIVGVEENLFPNPMSLLSRADLEEERRLFYVAITRAEKRATITYSSSRYRWGTLTSSEPSRFIDEIDSKFIEYGNSAARGEFEEGSDPQYLVNKSSTNKKIEQKQKFETVPPRKNLVKASTANAGPIDNTNLKALQVGMTVKHERFGTGKVIQLEGVFPNTKATVVFNEAGQKQLLLKFAKLDITES